MRTLIYQIISMIFLVFGPAQAGTASALDYYAVIFGYEDGGLNSAKNSHSFATFLAVEAGPAQEAIITESITISWLPESGKVGQFLLLPEIGTNFSLDETLAAAQLANRDVRRWGPVKINKTLFDRSRHRATFLESGRVLYVANDFFLRAPALINLGGAVNCIHAISDIFGFIPTDLEWGHAASEHIFDLMTTAYDLDLSPDDVQEILADQLGIADIARAD